METKRFLWFGILGFLIFGALGCPTRDNPYNPGSKPTKTATSTRTITNTPTMTSTPSITATRTATSTLTDSPTGTQVPVATDTPTMTGTPSATATPTGTPTSTATTAVTPFVTVVTFETDLQGWAVDNGAVTSLSGSFVHSGTGAAALALPGSNTYTFVIDYGGSLKNMAGESLSFWIYVDSVNITAVQPFVQSNTGSGFPFEGAFISLIPSNVGRWVEVRFTPTFSTANSSTTVFKIGIQFFTSGAGNAYVDDVVVGPTPTSWTFEDGFPDAFTLGGSAVSGPLGVGSPSGTGNSSLYSLLIPATFSAINQTVQAQYTFYPSASFTAMGISSIAADVMVDSDISNNGSQGVQLYLQSGGGYTFENNAYTNLTSGTWAHITFTPTFAGGSATDVKWFGVQFSSGGGGTAWGSGNLKVDNVQLLP